MKLDKESIIGISICMALLIAWPYIFKTDTQQQQNNVTQNQNAPTQQKSQATPDGKSDIQTKQSSIEKIPEISSAPDNSTLTSPKTTLPDEKEEVQKLVKLPSFSLSGSDSEAVIEPNLGGITNVALKNYFAADKKTIVELNLTNNPALKVEPVGEWKLVSQSLLSESENSRNIEKRFVGASGEFTIRQSFRYESPYLIDSSLEIINTGKTTIELPEFHISAGELPPVKFVSGDIVRSEYQSIDACLASNQAIKSQSVEKKPFAKIQENPVLWLAITNKYFALVLVPQEPFDGGNTMESVAFMEHDLHSGSETERFKLKAAGIIASGAQLEPGAKKLKEFKYFAGPKENRILKSLAPQTAKIMHFGWRWLEGISQILLSGLVKLKDFSGSYGMSIILLTIIVKLIFWPFTEKANSSMKKMQKIQPLVQEIRIKYKDDQQKMNAKIMQLYKEHKINPLGGCLPIFLQIPVFLALYNTLDGAIELRHSQFLWAQDLSLPDTVLMIPLGFTVLPLNPLILLMTATMVIQQKLTPSAADPMQQKMMMLMPFIMLFMLYSLPSGLTLYWTVSQIISILQLLLNRYRDKSEQENIQPQKPLAKKI